MSCFRSLFTEKFRVKPVKMCRLCKLESRCAVVLRMIGDDIVTAAAFATDNIFRWPKWMNISVHNLYILFRLYGTNTHRRRMNKTGSLSLSYSFCLTLWINLCMYMCIYINGYFIVVCLLTRFSFRFIYNFVRYSRSAF